MDAVLQSLYQSAPSRTSSRLPSFIPLQTWSSPTVLYQNILFCYYSLHRAYKPAQPVISKPNNLQSQKCSSPHASSYSLFQNKLKKCIMIKDRDEKYLQPDHNRSISHQHDVNNYQRDQHINDVIVEIKLGTYCPHPDVPQCRSLFPPDTSRQYPPIVHHILIQQASNQQLPSTVSKINPSSTRFELCMQVHDSQLPKSIYQLLQLILPEKCKIDQNYLNGLFELGAIYMGKIGHSHISSQVLHNETSSSESRVPVKDVERIFSDPFIYTNAHIPIGTYFRIHSNPDRFLQAYNVQWGSTIRFMDDDMMIIDKPPMVPTVPKNDNWKENVVYQLQQLVATDNLLHAVSRLDTCTSGLLLLGKSQIGARKLGILIQQRKVHKVYCALVPRYITPGVYRHSCRRRKHDNKSRPRIFKPYEDKDEESNEWQLAELEVLSCELLDKGKVGHKLEELSHFVANRRFTDALERSSRSTTASHYGTRDKNNSHSDDPDGPKVITIDDFFTQVPEEVYEVNIKLHTGRTHQIRLQFAALNAPLLGDCMYQPVAGKLHRGIVEDDDTSMFGPNPFIIALQAKTLEFDWKDKLLSINAHDPWWRT